MTESRFRLLLSVYAFSLFAAVVGAFLPSGYSAEFEEALANEPDPSLISNGWLLLALFGPFTLAVVAGLVGLFRLKSWGRSLSLYTTVAGLFLFPLAGPVVLSAIGSTLTEACSVLWGAVLACAYFSPASTSFTPLRPER